MKDSKIFFPILFSFKIFEMKISNDILLIIGSLTYIIEGEIKKFNSCIMSNSWYFLFKKSFGVLNF